MLKISAVSKRFGATVALDKVDFSLASGSVHALLGENGAGKSTLIKILAGAISHDSGSITLSGAPYTPQGPLDAERGGIAVVHQEPLLCPHLTVAENILLGKEPARFGVVDRARSEQRVRAALALVRFADHERQFSPELKAAELSASAAQLVTIARALAQTDCRVLVLDEPTSSLSAAEVARLFTVLRDLSAAGLGIVYVSHFLDEVARIADTFTVLRDGTNVATGRVSDVEVNDLVTLMAGRAVEQRVTRPPADTGDVVLELSELAALRGLKKATLALRRGEVFGIAGLLGSGRTELLRAIFGLLPIASGKIRIASVSGPRSPAERLAQGVGLLSENRKTEGLAENLSIADNLTLSKLTELGPLGLVLPSRQAAIGARYIERLRIKCRGPEQRVSELSGGNQQKVALARLLHHDVDVALLDEPTRGIDIRSRNEIYGLIDDLAKAGKAVLVVSSSFAELLTVADRIAVLKRGVLGEARLASSLDERTLIAEASGT